MDMVTEYGFCFRPERGRGDCSGRLSLWIDHCGRTLLVPRPYDVRHSEWDAVCGRVIPSGGAFARRLRLRRYAKCMARDLSRLEAVVRRLEDTSGGYTTEDVACGLD